MTRLFIGVKKKLERKYKLILIAGARPNFMEIAAYNSYNEINFWRTKSGLEVDFVLGRGEVAIEVKGSTRIEKRDLQPLNAFIEEYSPRKALVVCNEREERIHGRIHIMPHRNFLSDLWEGKIIH
ncbi:MAG: hypothetical protein U9Q38_05480 [Thermodesulfobacteriota bacterium]|nr:hypothetical protein [Thermodesulfobacteriota bacterium]